MAVVDMGAGSGRAGRHGVVVDRVGTSGIRVADLDDHPPADRVREVLAVGRSDKDAHVLGSHAHAPRSLARNKGIVGQEGDQCSPNALVLCLFARVRRETV